MTLEEIEEVLALEVPARLATFDRDGFPRMTPIWFMWESGAFYMTSLELNVQLRNLQRDPRATICIDIEGPDEGGYRPNRQVKAKAKVRLFPDDGEWTRRITLKYLSGPEGEETAEQRASHRRLVIELRPDKVAGVAAH